MYLNNQRLISQLNETLLKSQNSVFYKSLFGQIKDIPYPISSIEQFQKIPFTTKQDLRERSPFDFLTTSFSEVRRIHSSSGTKGCPTIVFYSDHDLDVWDKHLAYCFEISGLSPGDVFQTINGYGLFSGGLGFQRAAEKYGMTVIPIGMGNTERQVQFLQRFKVNGIITISSYLPILANYLLRSKIDPKKELSSLKAILIGAEPINTSLKNDLSAFFGVPVLSIYGLSEVEGPGVAVECVHGGGMHILSDSFYTEVIDPNSLCPLPYGEEGELVITTLDRECMPLVRYRTGDITTISLNSNCCESIYPLKMDYVNRRIDDMVIVRGVNVYPYQIQEIVQTHSKWINPFFQLIIDPGDNLSLLLSAKQSKRDLQSLETSIKNDIKEWLSLRMSIVWKEDSYFMSSKGKAKPIIDNRI